MTWLLLFVNFFPEELVELLGPFAEATQVVQWEYIVTNSTVVPAVFGLYCHVKHFKTNYLFKVTIALGKG